MRRAKLVGAAAILVVPVIATTQITGAPDPRSDPALDRLLGLFHSSDENACSTSLKEQLDLIIQLGVSITTPSPVVTDLPGLLHGGPHGEGYDHSVVTVTITVQAPASSVSRLLSIAADMASCSSSGNSTPSDPSSGGARCFEDGSRGPDGVPDDSSGWGSTADLDPSQFNSSPYSGSSIGDVNPSSIDSATTIPISAQENFTGTLCKSPGASAAPSSLAAAPGGNGNSTPTNTTTSSITTSRLGGGPSLPSSSSGTGFPQVSEAGLVVAGGDLGTVGGWTVLWLGVVAGGMVLL